ncbi:unnamed protein product [Cuscuta campestris]|uniref:DNL-type domain-containing protein n=1 Tax=Cuscuta campestris TaxID=132261 RepID=A0A484N202_9ASTE|nr:unnamed protein product [Cuscuta campestris]
MAACRVSPLHNPILMIPFTSSKPKSHLPIHSLPCHHNPELPRLRISHKHWKARKNRFPISYCSVEEGTRSFSESGSSDSSTETDIDLKLPRRSLLATFTCNACGARSQRFINRLAYERGLVYVQCSGCSKYHKLADNLGLVVEYNLRDGNDGGDYYSEGDQYL